MFLQVRAGDSGEELAQEPVEAGLDLDVEAAGVAVEAGVEVAATEGDSAAGGNGGGAPSL